MKTFVVPKILLPLLIFLFIYILCVYFGAVWCVCMCVCMMCGDFVCIYVVALGQTDIEEKASRNECRAQRRAWATWRLQTLNLPHTLLLFV